MTELCGRFISWWDGEYEGNCQLAAGHEGCHFDNMTWFDDEGLEQHGYPPPLYQPEVDPARRCPHVEAEKRNPSVRSGEGKAVADSRVAPEGRTASSLPLSLEGGDDGRTTQE